MSYTMQWGKNGEGKPIRSKNGGKSWTLIPNADAKKVKTCALSVWPYGGKYAGKTIKEIAAEDAEYLEWIMDMLHDDAPAMECLKLLLK